MESSGTPIDTNRELDEFVRSGSTDIMKPRYIDPVSPRNTLAGLKL